MRALIAAIVLAAAPAAAMAQTNSLSGGWEGGYISEDGADVNTFDIDLQQSGNRITGTATETNVFGDTTSALFLTSTIEGRLNGSEVVFLKTYDGSGGVTHTVSYRGRLEAGGRRIRGTYEVGGLGGTFEMVR